MHSYYTLYFKLFRLNAVKHVSIYRSKEQSRRLLHNLTSNKWNPGEANRIWELVGEENRVKCLYTESPNSLIIVLSIYRPDTALQYVKLLFKWYSTELCFINMFVNRAMFWSFLEMECRIIDWKVLDIWAYILCVISPFCFVTGRYIFTYSFVHSVSDTKR